MLLNRRTFWCYAYVVGWACTVGLAQRVTACDQRHGFFVVHAHAAKRLADVVCSQNRVGVAVRAFGVDVDQAHLYGCERILELTVAFVALIGQPLFLRAPVHVFLGFPNVHATATETDGLEAHGFQRHVTGEDHEVGPRDGCTVLLLHWPQQATRLVEIAVIGPAVLRSESLLAFAGAAAAITGAVGAGTVPSHANEKSTVVAPVRRPPVLGIQHRFLDVLLQGIVIDVGKRLPVVEVLAHGIGLFGVLAQYTEVKLVGPPFLQRLCTAVFACRPCATTRVEWTASS